MQEALGLRDYQVRAIRAVEEAIGRAQRELLVAKATGTGKTRTTIGLIHRLLKSQRFRRVLFLVDRGALGVQAQNAFEEVRLESLQTFAQNYDVMGLEDVAPAKETKVHAATVQGMVKRILWSSPDDPPVPIERYDCIIVDESHRGYTLDREMNEGERELDLGGLAGGARWATVQPMVGRAARPCRAPGSRAGARPRPARPW